MRTLTVLVAVTCAGCASVYDRVKATGSIEEGRAALQGYEPAITPYPPNAEAWYFGRNECVLFVDGKLRVSKSSYTKEDDQRVTAWEEKQVLCSPSDVTP
ncbi:MAG: hypothetical protein ACO1OB_13360 [Archangium sp.]